MMIIIKLGSYNYKYWHRFTSNQMDKQQLTKLLADSDAMTQQLANLKNLIINHKLQNKFQKPSSILVQAISHRQLLRGMAEALQSNRKLVQIKKQRIQKTRIVLEGLESYKKTLKEQIAGYHTTVESIEEYFQEPLESIDWENNYQEGQAKLKASLQKLKSKDQAYKSKVNKKNQFTKLISDKNKLYNNVMPKHVKKLQDQVLQTIKIFGVEANQTLQRIQNPKLAYIFDTFKTLKIAEKIQVMYNKEQHQFIDLVIKPIRLQVYERASQYNIKLQQKQIKIKICYLKPEFSKLVIGVDRRTDFSNRDIFHKLINREDAKPVFQEPSNQLQRNFNSKFVFVDWLEDVLCVSTFKSSQFLLFVRNRAFVVALTKYIFDNIKSPNWLNSMSPFLTSQISSKKFVIESSQKISFQDYKQLINIPLLIKKSLNNYEQQIRKCVYQNNSQIQQHLSRNRNKLLQLLSKYCLEQLLIPQIYQYYKVFVNYKGLKVNVIIIIPYEYPKICPKFKIISFDRTGESQSISLMLQNVQCKAKLDNKNSTNSEIQTMEISLNNSFSMMDEGSQHFSLMNYLNKLFVYIYKAQNQNKKGFK